MGWNIYFGKWQDTHTSAIAIKISMGFIEKLASSL